MRSLVHVSLAVISPDLVAGSGGVEVLTQLQLMSSTWPVGQVVVHVDAISTQKQSAVRTVPAGQVLSSQSTSS